LYVTDEIDLHIESSIQQRIETYDFTEN